MTRSRILIAILLMLGVAGAVQGEPMTEAEREELIAHLERTSASLHAAVAGLTPEQWSFKPAPDRWSIAENVEHLALTEAMLRNMTQEAMKEAASAERAADAKKDEIVRTMVPDRTTRFKTFPPLEPTGRWATQTEALEAFDKERESTKKLALEGGDLRSFVMDHPVTKKIDAYGNLVFTAAHTERHIQQIEEVKASEGYPR